MAGRGRRDTGTGLSIGVPDGLIVRLEARKKGLSWNEMRRKYAVASTTFAEWKATRRAKAPGVLTACLGLHQDDRALTLTDLGFSGATDDGDLAILQGAFHAQTVAVALGVSEEGARDLFRSLFVIGTRPSGPAPGRIGDVLDNLPKRNRRFTGRQEDLDKIHGLLQRQASVGVVQQAGLHAQGGAGKTSVALEYAWRCKDRLSPWYGSYPGGVFFIPCDADDILPSLAQLASRLGIRDVFSEAKAAERVREHLEHGPAALLVLDNVRDGEQWTSDRFQAALPNSPCRHLVTTRSEILQDVEAYRLGGLTRDDGVELLAKYRGDASDAKNKPDAAEIVEWFQGLAVGVVITGIYMQLHPEITWSALRALLADRELGQVRAMEEEVIRRQGGGKLLPDYGRRVDVIFDETLRSLEPAERLALEFASLFPEDDVPYDWLMSLVASSIAAADADSQAALAINRLDHLLGLRLLSQVDEEGTRLGVHRVLRRHLRDALERAPERLADRLRLFCDLLADEANRASQPGSAGEVTHQDLTTIARSLASVASLGKPAKALEIAVWLWKPLGERLGRVQELEAAYSCLTPHHETFRKGDAETRDFFVVHLIHLGGVARALGRPQAAFEKLDLALKITEETNPRDTSIATRVSDVGIALYDLGRFDEALTYSRRALRLERRSGGRPAQVGKILSNMSMIYYNLDRPERAERVARLSIRELSRSGEDVSFDLPKAQNNLAFALSRQARHSEALPLLRRVLKADRAVLDPEDPSIAGSYHNVGYCLQTMKRFRRARPFYEKALEVTVRAYGYDHENCLILYCNLMSLLLRLGKLVPARDAADAAVAIVRRLEERGEVHPQTSTIVFNAAEICDEQADYPTAVGHLLKAITFDTERYGPTCPSLAQYYDVLARIYEKTGEWAKAEWALESSISVERAQPKPREEQIKEWEERLREVRRKRERS